jgi:hypothetical protein
MSVLMMLRIPMDPDRFEQASAEHAETMKGIAGRGRERGAIHHAFYAGDNEVIVVDEWDSAENFEAFFESEQDAIGGLMQAMNAEGQPGAPAFHRRLDTPDAF